MTDPAIVDKLDGIFWRKFDSMTTDLALHERIPNAWTEYLNNYDITIISKSELIDEFQDMINNELFFDKKWICLENPERNRNDNCYDFLLVEKSFAEKVVSLGDLP